MPRPNLFIIGAMKSGTSSLYEYLNSHPDIFMSEVKEPGYFIDEFTRGRGEDWYLNLFASAGNALYIGEASTHYTKLPRFRGAPERIHEFDPAAKLIYIMRDPVERAISQYWHMVYSHNERRSIIKTVTREPHYLDVGNYAMQLAPYFSLFDKSQIYTLTFEDLVTSPATAMSRLYSWLGIDPAHIADNLGEEYNVGAKSFVQPRRFKFLNDLRFSGFWERASRFVPKPVRAAGRYIAERKVDRSDQEMDEVIEYLRPIQLEQTRNLCIMLKREFPEWKTLYNSGSTRA